MGDPGMDGWRSGSCRENKVGLEKVIPGGNGWRCKARGIFRDGLGWATQEWMDGETGLVGKLEWAWHR